MASQSTILYLLLPSLAFAMDMGGSSTMSTSMGGQMIPHLHTTRGDALWLEEITPRTKGAVAGACIFLVGLALFERFYSSWRNSWEVHWHDIAHELMTRKQIIRPQSVRSSSTSSEDSPGPVDRKDPSLASSDLAFQRTLPPWIPKHDIPRGVLYAGQALLTYLLMLAVMTYSVPYIVSILVGLATGELVFGRRAHYARRKQQL